MDASHRFREAVAMQLDWVNVLVTNRRRPYTTWRRRQAVLFAFMHLCFIMVFFCHFIHNMISWVLGFLMQTAAFCLSLFHVAIVTDYADKMNNSMELEQQLNPLIIAELSIRCFSLLHCLMIGSWLMLLANMVELAYDYYIYYGGDFLVDATTAWKKRGMLELDSRVRMAYQSVMVLAGIFHLVYSMVRI